MKKILFAVCMLSLTGCAELNNLVARRQPEPSEWYMTAEKVEIITEPPGADIEVNDEYQGKSPITVSVVRGSVETPTISSDGGYYREEVAAPLKIRALPVRAGDYSQGKYIAEGAPTPRKVFFSMSLGPAAEKKEISVVTDENITLKNKK